MNIDEQAAALKADIDRVLTDQGAAVTKAVAAALAAEGVHEDAAANIMSAAQAALDAFDPPPVIAPAPAPAPQPLNPADVPVGGAPKAAPTADPDPAAVGSSTIGDKTSAT